MGSEAEATWPRFSDEASRARYLAAYDAAAKHWPAPLEDLTVPTRLGPTHLIAAGSVDAPPLILLHSLAATALVWRANIAALSKTWRVYAVDVIGQPGKSVAHRRLRERSDYAEWLDDILDHLGVRRAPLVGCSYGAFLAASQAVLTPERVERLVLIGPPGVFAAMSSMLALRMRASGLERRLRRAMGDRRPPDATRLHPAAAPRHAADDGWRRLMGVTMAEAAELSLIKTEVFSRAELRRISAPTLLLLGEYEQLYEPEATLERARRLMPDIQAELVPGADHIAAMAQPDWVNARIIAFLRSEG